jgi:acetylornithine deacetylase
MSDLTWMRGFPAVKCGPGKTDRSHQLDEFVLQSEIVAARAWYVRWAAAFAGQLTGGAKA